uniref:Low photochemical bleaching 1 protein n=1 Tax=Chlamydomonas reinhardtii TaxID=3055 RepID=Q4VGM4_CHLRE|nr:low photochemical bleaching 1 protein [Chlamydomonas reinhardtii]
MQLAQRVTRVAAAAPGSPQPHKPYLGPFIRKAQQQPVAAAVSSSSSSSSASSFSAGSISISSGLGSKGLLTQLRAQQPQQQPQRAAASQQPQAPQAPQAPQPLFAAPADPLGGTVQSYEDEYVLPGWGVELPLEVQAERLRQVLAAVAAAPAAEDKVRVLLSVDSVAAFAAAPRNAAVMAALTGLPAAEQRLLLALPAMLQEHVLQEPAAASASAPEALRPRLSDLAARLARVETFYDSVGGLLGYQLKSLELIVEGLQDKTARAKEQQRAAEVAAAASAASVAESIDVVAADGTTGAERRRPQVAFHVPKGIDLAGEEGAQVGVSAAAQGLASLPFLAEIYPVGGAGDRLGLVDEATGESLPAAMLPYAGRSLLEVLLRDLQAREYLYFQLTGRQVTTPVAIMTSDAKGNHERVSRLLGELGWAGRGRDAFRLFRQPMVPVVGVEDGKWLLSRPLGPMMKPGGHGAIWKLMWDEGVFDWLQGQHGRRAALVRQISNPMAGMDTTLLALAGAGFSRRNGGASAFGFMSCERAVGAAEGMNVVQERKRWGGRYVFEYGVTNVEYTEFEKLGLNDEAVSAGSKTSVFPANTNVLYVGLKGARSVVAEAVARGDGAQLLPGLIFNLNKKVSYTDPLGGPSRQVTAGRMESTMQNMADYLTDRFEERREPNDLLANNQLSTFLVSNLRRKVTSSAKKRREPGSARIAQTPDGSFYDLQRNAWQILQRCGLKNVPEPGSPEQYLEKGPGFIFLFHPALGPLWDVISQKLVGGSLAQGSELVLECAEARLVDVDITGSLQVYAENVMGHLESPADTAAATATALHAALAEDIAQQQQQQQQQQASVAAAGGAAAAAVAAAAARTAAASSPALTMPFGFGTNASAAAGSPSVSAAGGGILRYGRRCGRVQMVNVRVRNAGIDWASPDNVYWKHQVRRHESCKVVLLGQSEFEAHDVTLTGSHTFVVPDGHRLSVTAAPDGAGIEAKLTPLTPLSAVDGAAATLLGGAAGGFQPSWEWQYVMDSNGAVKLSYVGTTTTVGSRSAPAVGLTAPVMAAAERQGRQVLDFSI